MTSYARRRWSQQKPPGAVANLKKTGLELVTKDIRGAERLNFDAPVQIDLRFTNAEKIKQTFCARCESRFFIAKLADCATTWFG
jgi:hypothetical protein